MSDIQLKIHETAYRLAAEGIWPTVNAVREQLGSGSNTTINQELKIWRQEFLSKLSTASRRPDWPPVLIESVEHLWQHACSLAEEHLESTRREVLLEKQKSETAVKEIQEQLTQTLAHAAHHEASIAQLKQRIQEQTFTIETLEQELAAQTVANQTLQEAHAALQHTHQAQGEHFAAEFMKQQQQHEQLIASHQKILEEREALAYERLEGVRLHLYQQAEIERTQFRDEKSKFEAQLSALSHLHAQEKHALHVQMLQQTEHYAAEHARLHSKIETLLSLQTQHDLIKHENDELKKQLNIAMENWQTLAHDLHRWQTQQLATAPEDASENT